MTRRFLLGACMTLFLGMAASVPSSGAEGRWKLADDGSCYFDAEDSGPDQCDPTPGRWKLADDGSCYFDESDSGPDQCTPPLPTEPNGGPGGGSLQVAALEAPVGGGDERARRAEQNHHVPPDRSVARDNR